jgi:hypothetical protein
MNSNVTLFYRCMILIRRPIDMNAITEFTVRRKVRYVLRNEDIPECCVHKLKLISLLYVCKCTVRIRISSYVNVKLSLCLTS